MSSRGLLGIAAALVGVVAGTFWLFRRSQSKRDLTEPTTPRGDEKVTPDSETKPTETETETKTPVVTPTEPETEPSTDGKANLKRGARVSTPWGNGKVVNYRSDDNIYEILLEVDENVTATVFCQEEWLSTIQPKYLKGEVVSTPLGDGVVEDYRDTDNIYTIRHTWDDHGRALSYLSPSSIWPKLSKFKLGDMVQTPSGPGKVVGYSSADGIYEVELKFDDHGGARAHLTEEFVQNLHRTQYSLDRYAPGDRVQTPYGIGVVKSFREDDQIYEIALQFDDHGSASAFLPLEVLEASAPNYEKGDYVLTPQGPGIVSDVIFSESGFLALSFEVELDTAEHVTYQGIELSPYNGFLSEPYCPEEERKAPILNHELGFLDREFRKDKFQHIFRIAKKWLSSVGVSDDDIRSAHAAFIHYVATTKDQRVTEGKYFVVPARRQTLSNVVNFFQKTYGECHPGLASVAAFLLLFLSAPEVIAYLIKIHTQPRYLPCGFTKKSLDKISPIFTSAFQQNFQQVQKHLQAHFILPTQIIENYLFYLNTNLLPFYSLVFFFTQFSSLGYSYVLQFALSLTEKLTEENLIFSVKETNQLYSLFKLDFLSFKVSGKELHDLGFEAIADSWEILDTERTDKYSLTGIETPKAIPHVDVPEPEWEEENEAEGDGHEEGDEEGGDEDTEDRFVIGQ